MEEADAAITVLMRDMVESYQIRREKEDRDQ